MSDVDHTESLTVASSIMVGELKIDRGIPSQLDRVADHARAHERAGYDGCWAGEINHDPFLASHRFEFQTGSALMVDAVSRTAERQP